MIGTGLQLGPTAAPTMAAAPPASGTMSVGGMMTAQSLGSIMAQRQAAQAGADKEQNAPGIVGLAGHIQQFWIQAREAKRDVEIDMIESLYARRGEYTAEKAARITAAGQPLIYMMLGASKQRQAEALFRDVLIGAGTEKPWTLSPEPVVELPDSEVSAIKEALTQELTQELNSGASPSMEDVRQRMQDSKDELIERLRDDATTMCKRMEDKMETQLDMGGFNEALDSFITDLTTFKTAFIAGPIVRNKPKLTWVPNNPVPVVTTVPTLVWERADPFDIYPAPWARTLEEGSLIRRHKLTRQHLTEMKGVDGFSNDSIDRVLELYGTGGLNDWLSIDSERNRAEGKNTITAMGNSSNIDAIQFWGSVSGQMLQDWGMTAAAVPDVTKEYQVEAWMIGPYVIKSVLNADPLGRRPLYGTSYERVPGSVWGNSPYDLISDCCDMCNAAARSLAANLGISSGPQVVVNVSRLPAGEVISQMYPWKIWQVEADPMNGTQPPITFFQPSSNAAELMGVYQKFSDLADEYTGIPKYMAGQEGTPGAGRTASGLSMMIGNASKVIKAIIGSIDTHVIAPIIDRLYYTNMRYATDPDLKGAVNVHARGAMSLTTKDSAQAARSNFLAATNNPTDMSILGIPGRAEVLRSTLHTLDLDPDRIIPPISVLKIKQANVEHQQQVAAAQAQTQPGAPQPGTPGTPGVASAPAPGGQAPSGQALSNGAPVTDTFSPTQQPGGQ